MSDQLTISEAQINENIKFYFPSFGRAFRKWIRKAYPEINKTKLDDMLFTYYRDFEDDAKIYTIEDVDENKKQYIFFLITYVDQQPAILNQTILNKVYSNETKEKIMAFLSNSFMCIKILLKKIEEHFNISIFEELLENSMFLYRKNTSHYLAYSVSFKDKL